MAYDSKCLDLAQYFLGCEGDHGDEQQASLAQRIQDAVEAWFGEQQELREPCLSPAEQRSQGSRSGFVLPSEAALFQEHAPGRKES